MENNADYNRNFEILSERSNALSEKENVEEKIKSFDYFKINGRPGDLWFFSQFLHDSNMLLRQKAADTIIHIFRKLKSQEELQDSLRSIRIAVSDLGIFAENFPAETYFELVTIASFNGNGYVREAAVVLLSRSNNPRAIRYLLLRAGDWVSDVREAAISSVRGYLQPAYREAFIYQLPLVEWLLQVKRSDLSHLYKQIIEFITSEPLSAAYIKTLVISDKSRMLLYSHQLKRDGLTPDLLRLILSNKDYLTRSLLFKYIPMLSGEEQEKVLLQLLQDHSGKIKLMALYAVKPILNLFKEEVFTLLSDESSAVRELTRSLLKGEAINFASLYRDNIQNGHKFLGSLMGLCELGSKIDIPVFEQYISDRSNKVKLTCLTALNRLDSLLARNYSLSLLTSSTKKLRTKCCEILSKNYDEDTLEQVRSIYKSGNSEHKRTILMLFNEIGGWKTVADLIYALSDPDNEVSDMAWNYLFMWRMKAVRTFTTPAPNDLKRAHMAYNKLTDIDIKMTYNRKKLWEELPFFLRP